MDTVSTQFFPLGSGRRRGFLRGTRQQRWHDFLCALGKRRRHGFLRALGELAVAAAATAWPVEPSRLQTRFRGLLLSCRICGLVEY